jgi:hypothetical protein
MCFLPQPSAAQDTIARKKKAYLTMNYFNEDGQMRVKLKLFSKDGTKKIPVQFAIVNLFLSEESKWGMMGNITTDSFGEGTVPLRKRFALSSAKMSEYDLLGSMKNDPRLLETQTKLNIRPSTLELSLYEEDSIHYAKAVLKEKDTMGEWVPVSGVKVGFSVAKDFTLLPTSATDENGEAILALPEGLKGDGMGSIRIMARVDDNESYGTLTATAEQRWGNPVRSGFMLAFNLIIICFFGIILYVLFQSLKKKSFS